jgi:Nuclease-related domain
VEANTTHTRAVSGGQIEDRSVLRRRFAGLSLPTRRNGDAGSNGRPSDEIATRFDGYLRDSGAVVLHHRNLPGKGGEISHLVVGPSGVTVIDSHGYDTSRVKFDGGTLRGSSRKRAKLLNPVLSQVSAVRELLADTPYANVPIEAAIAQRKVTGARVLQGLNAPRIIICGARTIASEAAREGPLPVDRVRTLAAYLDDVLT